MEGRPVWLASVSIRDNDGEIIATENWSDEDKERANALIDYALSGLGDESREVSFRMNVTLCRHRGLTDSEEVGLPESFKNFAPTDTAGSAIELLSVKGCSGLAIQPCENMGREVFDSSRPDLWLPVPCGKCASCLARDELRAA